MQFVRRDVWYVTFLEPGLNTPLPKKLTLKDEGKIRQIARKGEAWGTSEDRQLLDYADCEGRGCDLPQAHTDSILDAETCLGLPTCPPSQTLTANQWV
jgi:hypothetical protein